MVLAIRLQQAYTAVMDNSEPTAELIDISTWQQRLEDLAHEQEVDAPQIRIPKALRGRVNREEIASAFLQSFNMIGGIPRLAMWADEHPTEFYRIFGRLLPKESLTTHDGEIRLVHSVPPSRLDD